VKPRHAAVVAARERRVHHVAIVREAVIRRERRVRRGAAALDPGEPRARDDRWIAGAAPEPEVDELRQLAHRDQQRRRRAMRERMKRRRPSSLDVAGRQAPREHLGATEVGVANPEWLEDLAAQIDVERLAGRDLDRSRGDRVASVRVRVARARSPADDARPRIERECFARGQVFVVGEHLVESHVVESGGVLHEVRQRDRRFCFPRIVDQSR
jgi:hypothetical protein